MHVGKEATSILCSHNYRGTIQGDVKEAAGACGVMELMKCVIDGNPVSGQVPAPIGQLTRASLAISATHGRTGRL